MAVIKTITTETGATFPDQYCRIDEMTATKAAMTYTVGIYLHQDVADLPPHRAIVFSGEFNLYSPLNVLEQAYAHLKRHWPDCKDV